MNAADDPLSHVFFVTSRGYAADHWYAWVVKALNAHPEILAYLANEGSRPKYFAERTRSERPDLMRFARFLSDVGMTYTAVGDCYSYRADMMRDIATIDDGTVPVVNLVRHPYVWLHFYVRWRAHNMRMPDGETGPLDHEWSICDHDLYRQLGLKSYRRDDIEIWASYQGMRYLNTILSDNRSGVRQFQIEALITDRDRFCELTDYLTHGRLRYDDELLDRVYGWIWRPFRGEARLRCTPDEEYAGWPDWKREAMHRLLKPEARTQFAVLGYALDG